MKAVYWLIRGPRVTNLIARHLRNRMIVFAAFVWRRLLLNTTFIAVTGSFGKTTTKELIANILEQQFSVMRTPGNRNHRKFRGPEMTILRTRPWHKFAVLEIGAEKPGNIESAAKFVKPDIVVITNVKRAHTKSFNTEELIAQEKLQLLKYLAPRGCAIINQDNAYLAIDAVPATTKIIRFGESEEVDFRLLNATSRWPERLTLSVSANGSIYNVDTRLLGTHWSSAILAALAVANHCGVAMNDAIAAIRSTEPFWARMQPVYLPAYGATFIREYAHGELDALEVMLKFMEDARATRKIFIISDFSETEMRSAARAKIVGKITAQYADVGIFVGPIARHAYKSALAEGLDVSNAHVFTSTNLATEFLKSYLQEGDLVFTKGIMSHHLSRIYLGLIGDVKCTLEICHKQTECDNCSALGIKWREDLKGLMAPPKSYI